MKRYVQFNPVNLNEKILYYDSYQCKQNVGKISWVYKSFFNTIFELKKITKDYVFCVDTEKGSCKYKFPLDNKLLICREVRNDFIK